MRRLLLKARDALRPVNWDLVGLVVLVKVAVLAFGLHAFTAVENARLPSHVWGYEVWNRWDALAYLGIAQHGYTNVGEARFLLAYFPLYPWCVRVTALLLRNYTLAAFVVSGLGTVLAILLIQPPVRLDDSALVARRAVWMMLIFPTSFFLHIAYAESLFIALALGCFYAARRQ